MKLKFIFFVSFVLIAGNSILIGQCSNFVSQWPTAAQSTTSGTLANVTTCAYGGEYSVYNVTAGQTYTWTTCGDTDFDTQLTLWNTAHTVSYAYNDDNCGTQSTITWTATFTGQVHLLLSQYNCQSNSTCMTIQWACTTCSVAPPAGGANCGNPVTLTPGTQQCGTNSSAGSFPDGGGAPTNPCNASYNDGEYWFSYTGTGNALDLDMSGLTAGWSGVFVLDACPGSAPNCIASNTTSGTGNYSVTTPPLTAGQTYYIVIANWSTPYQTNFCLDATEVIPPPPLTNDNPCSAIPLNVGVTCSYTTYTNAGATATSGVPAPGCASYSGGDVWFTAVVPPSGTLYLDSDVGVITDGGMAVYTGTCGALSLLECDDDDSGNGAMSAITVTTLAPGTTVYVRFWEFGNNNNGTFDICAYEGAPIGPCGNSMTNDFCSDPAILTEGAGTWTSTTSSTYTADLPANVNSIFCGSIENNSWYMFIADGTTETFNISSVFGCNNGWGIQAQVYNVTTNVSGCCTGFSSVSNCYNPGNTNPGTVTATGLTIGQEYYLMIDGNAGDDCEFTVTGWTATGILPVSMVSFYGVSETNQNLLTWRTKSELDNAYFIIESSYDGVNYNEIGKINGAGNSNTTINYEFPDRNIRHELIYYRLSQIDYDGERKKLGSLTVTRELQDFDIYPNPTNGQLNFSVKNSSDDLVTIEYRDINGRVISEIANLSTGNFVSNLFVDFTSGIYFVRILNKNGEVIHIERVVKL